MFILFNMETHTLDITLLYVILINSDYLKSCQASHNLTSILALALRVFKLYGILNNKVYMRPNEKNTTKHIKETHKKIDSKHFRVKKQFKLSVKRCLMFW